MQKIIYFTAGAVATTEEKADITKLNALVGSPFEVVVRNGAIPHQYAVGNKEAAAYAAGTIPTLYNTLPVADPDNPPAPVIDGTFTGDALAATVTGEGPNYDASVTIVNGVVTAVTLTTSA